FVTTPVDVFLAAHPSSMTGIANTEEAAASLKSIQRLFRVTHRFDEIHPLIGSGFDSAQAIARLPRGEFVAQMGAAVGEAAVAAVYAQAQAAQDLGYVTVAKYQAPYQHPSIPAIPSPSPPTVAFPNLATLFGPEALCPCEECRSMLGPAAYLVD